MAAILKYLQEKGSERVHRTADGFPIRNQLVPFLKQSETDELELSLDARVQTFATDKVEDMAAYQAVLDRIANGLFTRLAPDQDQTLPPPRLGWLILVRWAEVKADVPPRLYGQGGPP